MLRPGGESGGHKGTLVRLVLAAFALSCANLTSLGATQAAAAESGASGISQTVTGSVPPEEEPKVAGNSAETYGPEQRAHELYVDAVEKLDAGRAAWAQKTFETVIARFPQSHAAAQARVQLGILYRRGATEGGPAQTAPIESAATQPPELVAAPTGGNPVWEQELRRNAAIQTRLRSEAGDRVFFSADSAELGGRARTALSAQAQWLNRWHEFEAAIEGHADDPGSEEDNLKLSAERAEAVRRRLVEDGVDASRLAIVAQGRTQRIAICPEGSCAAQNRRVVTLVFASGTRERLGLAAAPSLEALDAPEVPEVPPPGIAGTVDAPTAAERVGAAR